MGANSAMTSSHSAMLKMPKERMWMDALFRSVKLPMFCFRMLAPGSSLIA